MAQNLTRTSKHCRAAAMNGLGEGKKSKKEEGTKTKTKKIISGDGRQ